jgi:hypothetical protein
MVRGMSPLSFILLFALAAPPEAVVQGWHAPERQSKGAIAETSDDRQKPIEKAPNPFDGHYPGASQIAAWKFESSRDEEIYGWPPGWTRRHGPGFPRYVQVRVSDDQPPPGGRSLRVDLNGGAASAFGPTIPLETGVDYVLEGFIKSSGLTHDAAWLSITFLDSSRQKVISPASKPIDGTNDWQKVRIGPLVAPTGATSLIVGINVAPRGDAQDLNGHAAFGSLWLGRVPRIVLTARATEQKADSTSSTVPFGAQNAAFHVFGRGKSINIACLITGFSEPRYEVRLTLDDAAGRTLAEHRESLTGVAGRVSWQVPRDRVGHYCVHADVTPLAAAAGKSRTSMPRATMGFAIIDPEASSANSEFGWSLDAHDPALGLVPLGDLLAQSGIRSVKYPFPISIDEKAAAADSQPTGKPPVAPAPTKQAPDRIEPLVSFSDRLGSAGVRLVGELLPPPVDAAIGPIKENLLAVEAFSRDPKTWFSSIEPILARLATEIRCWQIGDDRDPGWTSCDDLSAVVTPVKAALDKIGQDLDVGIAWNFAAPLPVLDRSVAGTRHVRSANGITKSPLAFLALPCDSTATEVELAARLDATKSARVQRWLSMDALPQAGHTADDRIAHLVGRMITAKIHGAEGIYFAHPFDAERGLVGRDGSPSDLFLPWRTTALTLGGAPYAGDIDLAGGSQIHCFGNHGKYVGVLAGAEPKQEAVYLGNNLRCRDLAGNSNDCKPTIDKGLRSESPVRQVGWTSESVSLKNDGPGGPSYTPTPRSLIEVQRLPVFLTGLDGPVTEWQLNVAFVPRSLPSIPLSESPIALQMKNTQQRAVSGRVRITPPRNWYVEPATAEFRIEPGKGWKLPLKVALPNDVLGGRQMVTLEFEIQSDRFEHFTMYRPIEVTLGDVAMDAHAALTERGDLEVRQTLSNQGKRSVGFRCNLIAPDRRRQSAEVILQPSAKSNFVYRLPEGQELLGKPLWLRAEEIDGPRVLNYRLEAAVGK